MKEQGLFIIKPDGLLLKEDQTAKRKLQEQGLEIVSEDKVLFTPQAVLDFYPISDGLSQYWEGYLTTRPSLALVVEGEETNRKLAQIKRELRVEYSHDGFYTGSHCSDSQKDCEREVLIIKYLKI